MFRILGGFGWCLDPQTSKMSPGSQTAPIPVFKVSMCRFLPLKKRICMLNNVGFSSTSLQVHGRCLFLHVVAKEKGEQQSWNPGISIPDRAWFCDSGVHCCQNITEIQCSLSRREVRYSWKRNGERQKTELGEEEKEEDKEKGEWEERMKRKENEDKLYKRVGRESKGRWARRRCSWFPPEHCAAVQINNLGTESQINVKV